MFIGHEKLNFAPVLILMGLLLHENVFMSELTLKYKVSILIEGECGL